MKEKADPLVARPSHSHFPLTPSFFAPSPINILYLTHFCHKLTKIAPMRTQELSRALVVVMKIVTIKTL